MLKRIWLFLLVTALLLSFSACGKTPAEQNAPVEELVTDPITLIELDTLVVRVLKIEPENEAGYTVSVMVWNRTDIEFCFTFDDFAVNDLLYGEIFQFVVGPEEKELKRITLDPNKMALLGLDKVTKLSFRFYGMQTDITYDGTYFEKILEIFPLGEAAYKTHQRTPVQTDKLLIDNEYCTVTYVESFAGETDLILTLYVVNKTDKNLVLISRKNTLNGIDCNLYQQLDITPGVKSYESLFLSNDSLEPHGITAIESFAGDIGIYDMEHYGDGPLSTVSVSVSQ